MTLNKDITGHNFFRNRLQDNDRTEMAEKITPELLKYLKKECKEVELAIVDDEDSEDIYSGWVSEEITCNKLSKQDIGEWLVIVDYHN